MKKIIYICALICLMSLGTASIKAYNVSTMDDNYGIYCNYKDASGETYYFKYISPNKEHDFDIETDFQDKLGVAIESGRPGATLQEDKEWLLEKYEI